MGVARSRLSSPHRHPLTEPVVRHTALDQCSRDGLQATVCRHPFLFRTEHLLGVVVDLALGGPDRRFLRAVLVCTPNTDSREADAMRKLTFGMNLSVDGYIAAPGDDLGWSVPSDELFQWW